MVAIDVLSKYAWVSPMKDKTGKSLIAAFNSILKNGRKPEKLRTDKGTEFVNASFQDYLKKKGIDFYVATNEPKAAVVERLNRTLKSKQYRYVTSENTLRYIDDPRYPFSLTIHMRNGTPLFLERPIHLSGEWEMCLNQLYIPKSQISIYTDSTLEFKIELVPKRAPKTEKHRLWNEKLKNLNADDKSKQ